jgi:hypothetical protein
VIEAKLTASHFELELYVDRYEFPDFNTGRESNALTCEIELDPSSCTNTSSSPNLFSKYPT